MTKSRKYKIVFDLAQEYYWMSFAPLWHQMCQDEQLELYLRIGKMQKRFWGIFLLSQTKKVAQKFAGYRLTEQTKGFDAVICGDTLKNPQEYGGALLCNIEHAVSIKTQRYRKLAQQAGKVRYIRFVEGSYRQKILEKYLPASDIYALGLPKLDQLFDGSYSREKVINQLRLDPQKKIVLYAPSYKPTSIFELTPHLANCLDYNVIIKLHPYSWGGKYAKHSQHRLVEKIAQKCPHLTLIPENQVNIMPFMVAADTLITEGSSVMNEFLAMDKVGIIYTTDAKHSDGQSVLQENIDSWLKSFLHIDSGKQLPNALLEACNPSAERLKKLEHDKNFIYDYCDKNASKRVCAQIKKLLAER